MATARKALPSEPVARRRGPADLVGLLRELREKPQRLEFDIDPGAVDIDARTVDLAFSSEEPVERWWGIEILDCSPSCVRMDRLKNRAAVLVNHDSDRHVGVVEAARMDRDRKGRARVRFGRSEDADTVLHDIADGIRTKVSVGYRIHGVSLERQEGDQSTYRVTDWEPYEISIVSIPADDTVGVGRAAERSSIREASMSNEHSVRGARRALQREARALQLAAIPKDDRAGFEEHLRQLENDGEDAGNDLAGEYQRYRVEAIRTFQEVYPFTAGAEEVKARAGLAIADPTRSASAFNKEVRTIMERNSSSPTNTGRLEADREYDGHQRPGAMPYGAGAREIQVHGNLQAFKGPQAERRAYTCGQWFRSLVGDRKAATWCAENGVLASRTMTEGVFTAGGAVVPEMISAEIISNAENFGVFRRFARVWPMTSATLAVPVSGQGLTMGAVGETTATTASDLALSQITLTAKEFAGGCKVSKSLLEDSAVALGDFLIMEFGRVLGQIEDQCGFLGDGTSTYGGMVGINHKLENQAAHAGSTSTAASAHDTFTEIDIPDLGDLMGKIPEYARAGAAWYASATAKDLVFTRLMATAGGNNTETMRLGGGEAFLGYPVRTSQVLPAGSATDYTGKVMLLFGNLAQAAAFGDRRTFDAVIDMSRFIEYRQVYFQVTERFDVNSHLTGSTSTACGPIAGLLGGAG